MQTPFLRRALLGGVALALLAAATAVPLPDAVEVAGRVEGVLPAHAARTALTGTLVAPLPALGARVEVGDPLVELDTAAIALQLTPLLIEIDALRAAVHAREAAVGALGATGPAGLAALEAARAEASAAEAALAAAEGRAAALGEAQAAHSLSAPVAGWVAAVAPRGIGDTVLAGEALVVVQPEGPRRVVAAVPAGAAVGLRVGAPAAFWPEGATLGRLAAAQATLDAFGAPDTAGLVAVHLQPLNDAGPLGQPVRVRLPLPRRSLWDRLTGR